MKRILLLLSMLLFCSLLFIACNHDISSNNKTETSDSENTKIEISYETREEYGFIESEYMEYAVWGDYVFACVTISEDNKFYHDIRYQNVNYITEGGMSVFRNPFGGENGRSMIDSVTSGRGVRYIVVDAYATERNGGWPVLIMTANIGSTSKVIKYDMKTDTLGVLADDFSGKIIYFGIYGEYALATVGNGDHGDDIYRIDLDDGDIKILDNFKEESFRVFDACDGYIYYTADRTDIYRVKTDLENPEHLRDSYTNGFVYGDYLYFYNNAGTVSLNDKTEYLFDLARIKLDGTGGVESLLPMARNQLVYKNKYYHLSVQESNYGGYDTLTGNKIYEYNVETGKDKLIADYSYLKNSEVVFAGVSKDALLICLKRYENGKCIGVTYCHCDVKTGKLTEAFGMENGE